MGENIQELQLQIMGQEGKNTNCNDLADANDQTSVNDSRKSNFKRWLRIGLYTLFLLAGQIVGSFLGRLYYDNGGSSIWLITSLQFIGFPVFLPFYLLAPRIAAASAACDDPEPPSAVKLAVVYTTLGLLFAADSLLSSLGLMYLPVSTYALLSSSQLAFNAVFSFFLNAQNFTSYIINSLVLLTISSVLLVFDNDSQPDSNNPKSKFAIGVVCTIGASAGLGLLLSLTQFAFERVIKRETLKAMVDMIVYQSVVASAAIVIGLFASGDWEGVGKEAEEFRLGKVSYAMIMVWTTVIWQMFSIGSMGLIVEVSSLFSNAISIVSVAVAPVLAAIVYHEKMTGVKGMAMVLAIWGLGSYVYQQYLDDLKAKKEESGDGDETSEGSSNERLLNEEA